MAIMLQTNKQAFLDRFRKSKVKAVKLPDGTVEYVRSITPGERDDFENSLNDGKVKNLKDFRSRFLVLVLSDAEGNRIFTDKDVEEVKNLPGGADFEILFEEGYAFNGMSREALEELKKSSENETSSGSGSTSA